MYKKQYLIIVAAAMILCVTLFIFFICSISVQSLSSFPRAGCSININKDFTYEHPIILNTTGNEFILPNILNGLQFSPGEQIRLACPGPRNHLVVANATVKEVTATCISDTQFNVTGISDNENFKDLKCAEYPVHVIKRTGNKCITHFTEIGIGFEVSTGFVQIITVCFDEVKKDSLYSTYRLSSKIGSQQLHVPRPEVFLPGDYYPGIRITTLYTRKNERTVFARNLGSSALANKYISLTNDYFLSRGHLTAKADFVYGSQQRATFYYINVAPQWQTFNGHNWNAVEMSCRNYSSQSNLDLTVYTGVHGKAKLPDATNKLKELSLYLDRNNNQAVTVPEIYWKTLYDPNSQQAIAFVGHNNPYETDVAQKTICKSICDKVAWISWNPKSIKDGYSYCCDVRELRNVVKYIPDFPVKGLLL